MACAVTACSMQDTKTARGAASTFIVEVIETLPSISPSSVPMKLHRRILQGPRRPFIATQQAAEIYLHACDDVEYSLNVIFAAAGKQTTGLRRETKHRKAINKLQA